MNLEILLLVRQRMNISTNPLDTLICIQSPPKWMCQHNGAIVIDYELKTFVCDTCKPGKVIRRFTQREILRNLFNCKR
jgi:hypothetical protein